MPEVIAVAHPKGSATPGLLASLTSVELNDEADEISSEIGTAITECVKIAVQAGFDPSKEPFCVIVSFR